VPEAALPGGRVLRVQLLQGHQSQKAWCYSFSEDTSYGAGAASGGAVSTEALVRRRKEEQSSIQNFSSLEESIGYRSTKEKLIVFINASKNNNA
jgi:hypothetical protein